MDIIIYYIYVYLDENKVVYGGFWGKMGVGGILVVFLI